MFIPVVYARFKIIAAIVRVKLLNAFSQLNAFNEYLKGCQKLVITPILIWRKNADLRIFYFFKTTDKFKGNLRLCTYLGEDSCQQYVHTIPNFVRKNAQHRLPAYNDDKLCPQWCSVQPRKY